MRITVIVTPEEHAEIKRQAGLIPLSAYVRSKVLPLKIPSIIEYDPTKETPEQALKRGTTPCKHGLLFCKKCA